MMTGCTCEADQLARLLSCQCQTSALFTADVETCLPCQLAAGDEEHEKHRECEPRTRPELLPVHHSCFSMVKQSPICIQTASPHKDNVTVAAL